MTDCNIGMMIFGILGVLMGLLIKIMAELWSDRA